MIYLDNAATTRPLPEVVEAMLPYFSDLYGNASTVYELGQKARSRLMRFRKTLADLIGAECDEIYFTSGGSESDNWALRGACELWQSTKLSLLDAAGNAASEPGHRHSAPEHESPVSAHPHIITSKIEHEAVLATCRWLEKQGIEVTYLETDREGFIDPSDVEAAIRPNTAIISVMTANNEIGTIEPISEIGRIAHEHGVLFHTDAVQAFGQIPLDVGSMNIDLLSASSHKLYGPKGIGLLYIRKGILFPPLIFGGGQERGRRAGTENLPGAAGFANAAENAQRNMDARMKKESQLRDRMIHLIRENIPDVSLNGPEPSDSGPFRRLPGNVNFCFHGVEGEALLTLLDMQGICASSGSACSSGSLDPSHVLLATGRSHVQARSAVRFSIGVCNTEEDIVKTVQILARDVEKLRSYT